MKKIFMLVFLLLFSGLALANTMPGIPSNYWSLNLSREQVSMLNNVSLKYDNAIRQQEIFMLNTGKAVQNLSKAKNKTPIQMQALAMNMESLNIAGAKRDYLIQEKYREMNSYLTPEQLQKLNQTPAFNTPRMLSPNTIY